MDSLEMLDILENHVVGQVIQEPEKLSKRELFSLFGMHALISSTMGNPEVTQAVAMAMKAKNETSGQWISRNVLEAVDALLAELEKSR